jgi:hypothetical protein
LIIPLSPNFLSRPVGIARWVGGRRRAKQKFVPTVMLCEAWHKQAAWLKHGSTDGCGSSKTAAIREKNSS